MSLSVDLTADPPPVVEVARRAQRHGGVAPAHQLGGGLRRVRAGRHERVDERLHVVVLGEPVHEHGVGRARRRDVVRLQAAAEQPDQFRGGLAYASRANGSNGSRFVRGVGSERGRNEEDVGKTEGGTSALRARFAFVAAPPRPT